MRWRRRSQRGYTTQGLAAGVGATTMLALAVTAGVIAGGTTSTTTTTTTTTVPSGQTLNCAPSPHLCGFPDATNTGPRAGATLIQVPGQFTDGAVCGAACGTNHNWTYSGGDLLVTGDVGDTTHGIELASGGCAHAVNVSATVTNLKIDGCHAGGGHGAFESQDVSNSHTISLSYCELVGSAPSDGWEKSGMQKAEAGFDVTQGATYTPRFITVDHCNIHGFSTCVYVPIILQNGTVTMTNNFCHGSSCSSFPPQGSLTCQQREAQDGNSQHIDHMNGFQWEAGPNRDSPCVPTTGPCSQWEYVANNSFFIYGPCCQSGVVDLYDDFNQTSNDNIYLVLDHNLITTVGDYTLCFNTSGTQRWSYMAVTHNQWSHYSANSHSAPYAEVNPFSFGSNSNGQCGFSQGPLHTAAGDYQCGNLWDHTGAGADIPSTEAAAGSTAVSSCSTSPPWNIPPFTPYP